MEPDDGHFSIVAELLGARRDRPLPRCGRQPLRPAGRGRRGSPSASHRAVGSSRRSSPRGAATRTTTSTCCACPSTWTRSSASERLYRYLHEVFDANYPPTSLHRLFARLPAVLRENGRPQLLVLTTNYDDLLERAFTEAGELVRRRLVRGEARAAPRPLPPPPAGRRRRHDRAAERVHGTRSERAAGDPQAPRGDRPRGRTARQLRHHREQLHRLPRRLRRRGADPLPAPGADGGQPLPVPRLLDARLEPAGHPEPHLGRAAARPQVVGSTARPRPMPARARSRRRSGGTAATWTSSTWSSRSTSPGSKASSSRRALRHDGRRRGRGRARRSAGHAVRRPRPLRRGRRRLLLRARRREADRQRQPPRVAADAPLRRERGRQDLALARRRRPRPPAPDARRRPAAHPERAPFAVCAFAAWRDDPCRP